MYNLHNNKTNIFHDRNHMIKNHMSTNIEEKTHAKRDIEESYDRKHIRSYEIFLIDNQTNIKY